MMDEKRKHTLYKTILIVSITVFVIEVFLLQKPSGVWGLLICLFCIYAIFGSAFKLCQMNPLFKKTLISSIDLLFWLP